jgi:CRP-like cAMP-binding protein
LVRVRREGRSGEVKEETMLGEGSSLCEAAVLSDEPCTASVYAEREASLLMFSSDALAALSEELPHVASIMERFAMERLVKNVINSNPFFMPFDSTQRQSLIKRFTAQKVPAGTILVDQNEPVGGVHLILHGIAEVVRIDGGKAERIEDLGSGDCFGESSCLADLPMKERITTTTDATVMFLPKKIFSRLVAAFPELEAYYADLD